MTEDIHANQPILTSGAPSEEADRIVILLHGRGATAESMLPLADAFKTVGVRFLIPQAAQNRWYPQTAFGPLEENEPDLSSALIKLDALVSRALESGFTKEQIFLGGFSQGACLALEYVARNAQRYGGLFVLSGALIGPPGMPRNYNGTLGGMPVFIGGSDVDPWIKQEWMKEAADVMERMGGAVDFRTYPGMPHTVNDDEINAIREMIQTSLEYT